jgi:hypothetical protein
MSALGAFILLSVLVIVITGTRRMALLGVVIGVLFLTQGMSVNIGGTNLFAFRFVELAAFLRVLVRKEYQSRPMHAIDRTVLKLYIFTAVVFLLRSSEDHAYQLGRSVDALLCYFSVRGLLKSSDDLRWMLRMMALLFVPYVGLLVIESVTQKNPFTLLGGAGGATWLREDRVRCIGSFRHPSLLGALGACFLPLYIGLSFDKSNRKAAIVGIVGCLAIVWASNSGGPASGAAAAMAGWALWGMRTRLKVLQYGFLAAFCAAAILMKAPVWYLLARVSSITGGTGWHRSYLIDRAVHDLGNWWLVGMPIRETAHWFPYVIPATGGADITNQFLVFGLTAGLGAMLLFVILLVIAFKHLGRALLAARQSPGNPAEPLLWGIGVCVIVHISTWLGISYFDQSYALWLLHLSALVAVTSSASNEDPAVSEHADVREVDLFFPAHPVSKS